MEKLTGKDLNRFYCRILIDAIDQPDLSDYDAIQYGYQKFKGEYQWQIDRVGEHKACTEWLQGLGLSIPYTNHDIIGLLEQTGHVNEKTTEKQQDQLLENYWSFMASKLIYLANRKPAWFK